MLIDDRIYLTPMIQGRETSRFKETFKNILKNAFLKVSFLIFSENYFLLKYYG